MFADKFVPVIARFPQRGQVAGVACVAESYTDIAQESAALGAQDWGTAEQCLETRVVEIKKVAQGSSENMARGC